MDYEKAYKEALERARNLQHDNCWVTSIFPELQESRHERIRKELMSMVLTNLLPGQILVRGGDYNREDAIDWLKKQTTANEMQTKCKQNANDLQTEWGEEDEKMINRLRAAVREYAFQNDGLDVNGDFCEAEYAEMDNWLSSLHYQPHWKPTEEQMETVHTLAIKNQKQGFIAVSDALFSLYHSLKKL